MASGWRRFCVGVAVSTGLAAFATHADEGRGEGIYDEFCASCHGSYGRGDGPLAASLKIRATDFADSAWLAGRSDEQIIQGITGGHSRMAVANVIDADALADTVAYIRSLSVPGERVSILQGADIYNAICFACHGAKGDGKGPAAADPGSPQPRDFTSKEFVIEGREDEIARTIALGAEASFHGSSFMPAWGSSLSEQQIRDLIAYLKTFQQP
jgi:cbb3-type cytochrome c oxidase subunit III